MKINEIKERDMVNQPYLITSVKKGVQSNGSAYLSIVLQDNTGTLDARLWSVTPVQEEIMQVGDVVQVEGVVNRFNQQLQMKITNIHSLAQASIDFKEFTVASKVEKAVLIDALDYYLGLIENDVLKNITQTYFKRYEMEFFIYPAAARYHHEYVGGLATHTYEMLQIAESLGKIFPQLNMDLLYAGIICHDIGKINEFTSAQVVEYGTEGKLLGHISMSQAEVFEISRILGCEDCEEATLLRHMILSHHGQYEFGSPVLPMILEAEVLNMIDNLDARIDMFSKQLEQLDPGSFSPRVYSLESRPVYKPLLDN